jgi:hypothetical protein
MFREEYANEKRIKNSIARSEPTPAFEQTALSIEMNVRTECKNICDDEQRSISEAGLRSLEKLAASGKIIRMSVCSGFGFIFGTASAKWMRFCLSSKLPGIKPDKRYLSLKLHHKKLITKCC